MAEKKEPKYKVKVPKLNATKKTYAFSLSLSGLISAVGAGVLALTFFFVMGILIGRGYRPEADVPPLQQIMPSAERSQADELAAPKVLELEELDYADRLSTPTQQVMDQPEPKPVPAKSVKQPVTPKKQPVVKSPIKPEAFDPATAKSGEQVYDYVYQVASFKKADMAAKLRDALVAAGLRATVAAGEAKGSTWHRVQVLHYGTPSSTDGMKAILAKHGIKKPLLKKKTLSQ
ncbi:SPOR domain-containing protein [Pseudodesulfovibrio sp. JC047]|uniref:SPOR domain-containing protein n=1 Tax=Pseudodesulfovibrio sp. JC047 TaxID=2683199 RepID=UPI0013D1877C|nr:SPOR domain-containing protein [Pseudodesulfovibrio sp. JC047]NDV20087.1 SPOR domain-containing protein [Pseudodesulfovibrio sp. JC047]